MPGTLVDLWSKSFLKNKQNPGYLGPNIKILPESLFTMVTLLPVGDSEMNLGLEKGKQILLFEKGFLIVWNHIV